MFKDECEKPAQQHKALIVSDQPINLVNVIDGDGGGRWFRILCCLVESGAWARMNDSACRVYVVLAKHCRAGCWLAWPGVRRIRELSGVSRAQVYRAINELEVEGLLRRRTRGGGRGRATTYELLELPSTPSLPFGERVTRVSGKGCTGLHRKGSHGRDVKGLTGETPTRVQEQDNSRGGTGALDRDPHESLGAGAAAVAKALAGIGVDDPAGLIERFGVDRCRQGLTWLKSKRGDLVNRPGLLIRALENDWIKLRGKSAAVTAESISESLRLAREASERVASRFYGEKWGSRSS